MCIDGLIPFTALDPTRDDIIEMIVEALDRAERANVSDKKAVAEIILRDLRAVRVDLATL